MVKIERSFPAPDSLAAEAKKANGSYREKDVVERLKKDFHNKCYICGLGELQDPNVEHLLPHKNGKYPDRKFDWQNLFWSCGHCNGIKNNNKYDEGIIDCCRNDPEKYLQFELNGSDVIVTEKCPDDEKVKRTALLLREVFGKQNTGMRTYTTAERVRELQKEMNMLYKKLEVLHKNPKSKGALRNVTILLKRESAFAAFKRNYVRDHAAEYPKLQEYVVMDEK